MAYKRYVEKKRKSIQDVRQYELFHFYDLVPYSYGAMREERKKIYRRVQLRREKVISTFLLFTCRTRAHINRYTHTDIRI